MSTAAKHGQPWTAAIIGSVGLHASLYALLSLIERPTPSVRQGEPLMAYIVPAPRLMPEPPPSQPEALEEAIRAPPPQPVRPASVEPEQQLETGPEPPPDTQGEPALVGEPPETETAESGALPSLTRYEWYSAIPEAIARMRAAEEQAPRYRTFGDLDALIDEARRAATYATDMPAEGLDALLFETTSWGEERAWINEHCYATRYAPGSVLAQVHQFSNVMINCEGSSAAEPQNDLFIEAKPAYLEDN